MRIEEVSSTAKSQRVATHTHIKGLGLEQDGTAQPQASGEQHVLHTVLSHEPCLANRLAQALWGRTRRERRAAWWST